MSGAAVTVTPAGVEDRPLIEGLFQFYVYDFSEFADPDTADFEPDARGSFGEYAPLDSYWREAARIPLIIRRGARPVGFALVNDVANSGRPAERNMAEFFVMRKHRRGGVGRAAVWQILTAYPGEWEVALGMRNLPARAFWPRAVAETPGVRGLVTLEGDGVHWTGPVLRFTVEA